MDLFILENLIRNAKINKEPDMLKLFERNKEEECIKDREKELKHLIYLRNEIIKQSKKEIKQYSQEIETLNGEKRLSKSKIKNKQCGDKNEKIQSNKRIY